MELQIFETARELNCFVADEIETLLKTNKHPLLCIAAGNTSLGLFDELADRSREGRLDLSGAWFIAMDEWLGMNASHPGSCGDFLTHNFLSRVGLSREQVRLVDGAAADPEGECKSIRQWIDRFGGIDYLLLGCGMNGHLALNEPGTAFDSSVHITALDPVTQSVGRKYFSGRSVDLQGGITIGIREIRDARRVVLSLTSAAKQGILKKIVDTPVSPAIPATVVKELPQGLIICDREAAALL